MAYIDPFAPKQENQPEEKELRFREEEPSKDQIIGRSVLFSSGDKLVLEFIPSIMDSNTYVINGITNYMYPINVPFWHVSFKNKNGVSPAFHIAAVSPFQQNDPYLQQKQPAFQGQPDMSLIQRRVSSQSFNFGSIEGIEYFQANDGELALKVFDFRANSKTPRLRTTEGFISMEQLLESLKK